MAIVEEEEEEEEIDDDKGDEKNIVMAMKRPHAPFILSSITFVRCINKCVYDDVRGCIYIYIYIYIYVCMCMCVCVCGCYMKGKEDMERWANCTAQLTLFFLFLFLIPP